MKSKTEAAKEGQEKRTPQINVKTIDSNLKKKKRKNKQKKAKNKEKRIEKAKI